MLGAEEPNELDLGGVKEDIDRGPSIARATGVVGHEPHPEVSQRREAIADQDIDPALDRVHAGRASRWRSAPRELGRRCDAQRCVGDCGRDQSRDLGPQRQGRRLFSIRVQAAGENYHKRLGFGIDPQASARKSRVAKAGGTEQVSTRCPITRLDIPSEPAALAWGRRRGVGHEPYGQGRKNAPAARADAAIQERLGIHRQIVGRRKQARVTGDTSQSPGTRVVDNPAQHFAARLVALGGRDSVNQDPGVGVPVGVDWAEMRVGHTQRHEDVLFGEHVEPLAAAAFDEPSQHEETHVGVTEMIAGTRYQIEVGDPLPGLVGALLVIIERVVGNEARAMAEKLLDGDRALAVTVKLGKHTSDSVGRAEPALVDQDHDRRGRGDRLGERCQIKDRVAGHCLRCRLDRPQSRRTGVGDPAPAPHQNDRAWDLPLRNGSVDGCIDPLEAFAVKTQRRGQRFRQVRPRRAVNHREQTNNRPYPSDSVHEVMLPTCNSSRVATTREITFDLMVALRRVQCNRRVLTGPEVRAGRRRNASPVASAPGVPGSGLWAQARPRSSSREQRRARSRGRRVLSSRLTAAWSCRPATERVRHRVLPVGSLRQIARSVPT